MSTQFPMQGAIQKAAKALLTSTKYLKLVIAHYPMDADVRGIMIKQLQSNTEALVLLGYKVE